jgi:hypothetical protein
MMRRALVIIGALLAPLTARAQDPTWRTVDIARQLRDSQLERIRVQYRAGKVDIRATNDPLLYAMHLRYDENRAVPLHRYDAEQHIASLGVESSGHAKRASTSDRESGELRLQLPTRVPLDLDLEFGGTESRIDLGDLSLQSVRLECGATDATMLFSKPNRIRMREMELNVGAADFTALHLGNANADQIRVRGGVGSVDLDFSGAWTHDLTVTTRLILGELVLRVPSDVGVRVEVSRMLTSFEHSGLVKRDDAWYSPNFDSAPHKLRIRAETMFGQIEVKPAVR